MMPWWTGVVANVFVHRELLDNVATESGLEDELSDTDETECQQKIIYKIGALYKSCQCRL